ncbi:MAG: Asp/Glu/hydantoin racemase, partial [Proteobacteria bacterium]|nr:Asp/Glu/hydantoin racemase [Pseudomonadota bacterium]
NSDLEMTQAIKESASENRESDLEISCLLTPGAPKFIDTYQDAVQAIPGMIQLYKENEQEFDAFIIACHCDPNLDLLKEISNKPVVGIGESSMKIASMLGHRFSVISTSPHSIPNKEALIRSYHLQDQLASIKAPLEKEMDLSDHKKYLVTARRAIEEDRAEVIVLGCAGMAGLDKSLERELGVPVLDGVKCALIIASGLVRFGYSTSKIRRYRG